MTRHQYRCVYASGTRSGVCFIDADSEQGAREFFARAFPTQTLVTVTLEPTDVCGNYERREVRR